MDFVVNAPYKSHSSITLVERVENTRSLIVILFHIKCSKFTVCVGNKQEVKLIFTVVTITKFTNSLRSRGVVKTICLDCKTMGGSPNSAECPFELKCVGFWPSKPVDGPYLLSGDTQNI